MMAALENFCAIGREQDAPHPTPLRKMLILGDMRELWADSEKEHQQLTDVIAQTGISEVWLVGSEFGKTDCPFRKFTDVEAVKAALQHERPEGCLILVKGSNSTRLYELPPLL